MAYFSFTHRIATGRPIEVYGHGAPRRDFTYIDDVVDGVVGALGLAAEEEIFNLGNHRSESLLHFIEARVATSSSLPPISPADSRDRTGDCGAEGGGRECGGWRCRRSAPVWRRCSSPSSASRLACRVRAGWRLGPLRHTPPLFVGQSHDGRDGAGRRVRDLCRRQPRARAIGLFAEHVHRDGPPSLHRVRTRSREGGRLGIWLSPSFAATGGIARRGLGPSLPKVESGRGQEVTFDEEARVRWLGPDV